MTAYVWRRIGPADFRKERLPWPPGPAERGIVDECCFWILYREDWSQFGGEQWFGLHGVALHAAEQAPAQPILVLSCEAPHMIKDWPLDQFFLMDAAAIRNIGWAEVTDDG